MVLKDATVGQQVSFLWATGRRCGCRVLAQATIPRLPHGPIRNDGDANLELP